MKRLKNQMKEWKKVEMNGKWNYVNKEGKYLLDEWAVGASEFYDGLALIGRGGKWNYVNEEGEFLLSEWVDDAWFFSKGCAPIKRNGKWEKIDTRGEIVSA